MTVQFTDSGLSVLEGVDRELLSLLDAMRDAQGTDVRPVRRVALEYLAATALRQPETARSMEHVLPSTPRDAVAEALLHLRQRRLVELTSNGFVLSDEGVSTAARLRESDDDLRSLSKALRELAHTFIEQERNKAAAQAR